MKVKISKDNAEMIFKEHSNYIFRVALFLTKSKELADDITQETFIKIFEKYHTYNSSMPINPWIYKITLNITRNIIRKQKWLTFTDKLPESNCPDIVESSFLKNEEEKALWKEINNLSLKSREVIVLHFYSDMKLKEISDSLGIPIGTCKSRLNLALNTLRKQIPINEFRLLDNGGELYETIQ